MNTATNQLEVVESGPRWMQVGETTLAQHRNLSQEKRTIGWVWPNVHGGINLGDTSPLFMNGETRKRWEPLSESWWQSQKERGDLAGTTCRWCPDPFTDGYREFFPSRCNDCNTLNSYRYRGRQAALKLLAIKYSLDLESILWTFTFPLVESNRPLEEDEIKEIAKERRLYISQNLLRDKKIWHDKFVGINVMECEVTEPGETRNARFWDDDYERVSNMWTYHIHGHYLILSPKDSKVNLKLAYQKFGCPNKGIDDNETVCLCSTKETTQDYENNSPSHEETCTPEMRLYYKHERDYDRRKLDSKGEVIGTRDEMKIMRDYLVGYARKDCLGKLAWNGDTTWRKVRTNVNGQYLDIDGNELYNDLC